MVEPVEVHRCLDLPCLCTGLCDQNTVGLSLGRVDNIRLDRLPVCQFVVTHVIGDWGAALALITVYGSLVGNEMLVNTDGRRASFVGIALGGEPLLVLTRILFHPHVQDHEPLETKQKRLCMLPPGTERSDYSSSSLLFHPEMNIIDRE